MKQNTNVSTKAQEEVKLVKHYGLKRMAHTLRLQIEIREKKQFTHTTIKQETLK